MNEANVRQASVRHSNGLRHLIDAAKPYVARPQGMGITINEFFETAAGLYATKILTDLGILNEVKVRYEAIYGPLPVYDLALLEGGMPNGGEEPALDPLLENVEEGESMSDNGKLGDE